MATHWARFVLCDFKSLIGSETFSSSCTLYSHQTNKQTNRYIKRHNTLNHFYGLILANNIGLLFYFIYISNKPQCDFTFMLKCLKWFWELARKSMMMIIIISVIIRTVMRSLLKVIVFVVVLKKTDSYKVLPRILNWTHLINVFVMIFVIK